MHLIHVWVRARKVKARPHPELHDCTIAKPPSLLPLIHRSVAPSTLAPSQLGTIVVCTMRVPLETTHLHAKHLHAIVIHAKSSLVRVILACKFNCGYCFALSGNHGCPVPGRARL
jgi:sulfatase maturation enzyme AslB (radical SAM superfamily)